MSRDAPVQAPEKFSASGERQIPARWWTAFGDSELNELVAEALNENFDLAAAWQRLEAARAVADRASSDLLPSLDAEADGSFRREDARDFEELSLGLAAAYEVDLWGRIESEVDAERLRAEARLENYRAAALSLSAEVARTWYRLVEARSRRELLNDQVATNEKVIRLLETRFGSGQVRAVDILRQRRLLESTREELSAAKSTVGTLSNQLAVLLGRPTPGDPPPADAALPEPPPLPDTGVPADLLQRRPDVRRARDLLRAADRDLAAAVANQYPRLNLAGSLTTEDTSAEDLFDQWARSFAGSLVAPLFDAGQRAAEVDRRAALEKQRLFEYGQTILQAFRDVEDALARAREQREQIDSIRRQVRLAEKSYEQLRRQFFNGVSDYIDVLTALTDEQRLRRDLITARRRLLDFRIALYRALAGGFATERESRDGDASGDEDAKTKN